MVVNKQIILLLSLLFSGFVFSQDPINFTAANNNTTVLTCNGFIIDDKSLSFFLYFDEPTSFILDTL